MTDRVQERERERWGELAKSEARFRKATAHTVRMRAERNAAIAAALDAGWSHADIARATGLTRSRVGQIADARR
jgi:hypothetical protein